MHKIFLVSTKPRHHPLVHRFPLLFRAARKQVNTPVTPPGRVATPNGTLAHALLYAFGHGHQLDWALEPSPADIRSIGSFLATARGLYQGIHLFVPIDPSGTVASNRNLDPYLRIFSSYPNAIKLHPGFWNATSHEKEYHCSELASLGLDVASDFELDPLHSPHSARAFLESRKSELAHDIGYFFLTPDPLVFGQLPAFLHELTGQDWPSLGRTIAPSPHRDSSARRVTNILPVARYYWGDIDDNQLVSVAGCDELSDALSSEQADTIAILDDSLKGMDQVLHDCVSQHPSQVFWLDSFRLDNHFVSLFDRQ